MYRIFTSSHELKFLSTGIFTTREKDVVNVFQCVRGTSVLLVFFSVDYLKKLLPKLTCIAFNDNSISTAFLFFLPRIPFSPILCETVSSDYFLPFWLEMFRSDNINPIPKVLGKKRKYFIKYKNI